MRVKGRLAYVGQSFKDALKSLTDEISGKIGDPMLKALRLLRLVAEKFYEFIVTLIDRMFNFLSLFADMAKKGASILQ